MKTLSAIYQEIAPTLEDIHLIRKKLLRQRWLYRLWYLIPFSFFTFCFVIAAMEYNKRNDWDDFIGFLYGAGILTGFLVYLINFFEKKKTLNYRLAFKDRVLPKLVRNLYPTARYLKSSSMNQEIFMRSGLFAATDKYKVEDYISGLIANGGSFRIGELITYNKRQSKRQKKGEERLKFRGLFLELARVQALENPILVLPTGATYQEATLGELKQLPLTHFLEQQQITYWKEAIDFCESYTIYFREANDLPTTLTPALLGALYNFYQQGQQKLSISLVGEKVFLSLEQDYNWLETSPKNKHLQEEDLQVIYAQLVTAFDLLESLNKEKWEKIASATPAAWEEELYQHLILN